MTEDMPEGHGLPGLPKDAKRVYEGIVRTGATSPTSGRDAKWLAKELHMGRKDMEHQLHLLEGKGVVGHQTSGHDTNWYVKRT